MNVFPAGSVTPIVPLPNADGRYPVAAAQILVEVWGRLQLGVTRCALGQAHSGHMVHQ